MLGELTDAVRSQDIKRKHYGIIGIKKLMSHVNLIHNQQVIGLGILSTFIELVKQHEYPQLRLDCARILINIAAGAAD